MTAENFIKRDLWFAWRPVLTEDDGWAWFRVVVRVTDERPLIYLGLMEVVKYYKL